MLKCMNLTLKQTFGVEGDLSSQSEMGVRLPQLSSSSEFIATAASYLKGYMLNSLSDLSGTSSVAIDNKIEQAMDLVKSHLMFAVREEVEVLKEQIKDLLEKNAQLEYENKLLRDDASPDTIAKLRSIQP